MYSPHLIIGVYIGFNAVHMPRQGELRLCRIVVRTPEARLQANPGPLGGPGTKYRLVFGKCWNILIDNSEDCHSYIMRAQDFSIYRKAVRTKDGRLPPEPVLGDSAMSGRHLRSVISGRPLF